jgi:hypothetical protein
MAEDLSAMPSLDRARRRVEWSAVALRSAAAELARIERQETAAELVAGEAKVLGGLVVLLQPPTTKEPR